MYSSPRRGGPIPRLWFRLQRVETREAPITTVSLVSIDLSSLSCNVYPYPHKRLIIP